VSESVFRKASHSLTVAASSESGTCDRFAERRDDGFQRRLVTLHSVPMHLPHPRLAVVLATVAVGVYTAAVWWLCQPLVRAMVRPRAPAEARK
jgi:hypothetical protein